MRKKTAAIVTGFMITLGMLGGCGSAGDSTGNANASGENHLNFGCYVYSTSFDPAAYQNASWQGMRWGITETLYRFNDDSTIRPWLSDSYEVSEDVLVKLFGNTLFGNHALYRNSIGVI